MFWSNYFKRNARASIFFFPQKFGFLNVLPSYIISSFRVHLDLQFENVIFKNIIKRLTNRSLTFKITV
jgi:hypothetical protein